MKKYPNIEDDAEETELMLKNPNFSLSKRNGKYLKAR